MQPGLHDSQAEVTEYIGRSDGKDLIRVTVTVETESQRAIVIGRGGMALKELSTASRHGIEEFLGKTYLKRFPDQEKQLQLHTGIS